MPIEGAVRVIELEVDINWKSLNALDGFILSRTTHTEPDIVTVIES